MTEPKPPDITDGMTDFGRNQYKRLLREQLRRECEALRLYEPMPHQDAYHRSTTRKVIMQKGNQVGGTLCGAVEVARAVTGQDPYGKYPKTNGIVAMLGYGEGHIGTTFYQSLFLPGAFDVIKDLETDKWRSYRPWPAKDGGDLERADDRQPAPPLIPSRFIEGRPAWVKRSERIFSLVRFTTGWVMRAYNSAGDPGQAQGFQADLYWVDEDVATPGWISEIFGRIIKRRGLLRWTALPHGKNNEMMGLLQTRPDSEDGQNTQIIRATVYDNKYLPDESRKEMVAAWRAQGEEIYRQRALGELNLTSSLMYPTFSRRFHDILNTDGECSKAQQIMASRECEPPEDWTKYVSVDPGYSVLAVMFLAVPPPDLGDEIFVYDECYIVEPSVPVAAFASALASKTHARTVEAYIMDMHGARLRSVSSGEIPIDKYIDALRQVNAKSESMGYGFRQGEGDRKRREEILRTMLAPQRSGRPMLQVSVGRCPNFCAEMEGFRRKKIQGAGPNVRVSGSVIYLDEGERRYGTHAIDCVEQAVALSLEYRRPRKRTAEGPIDWVKEWGDQQRRNQQIAAAFMGHRPFLSFGPQGVDG